MPGPSSRRKTLFPRPAGGRTSTVRLPRAPPPPARPGPPPPPPPPPRHDERGPEGGEQGHGVARGRPEPDLHPVPRGEEVEHPPGQMPSDVPTAIHVRLPSHCAPRRESADDRGPWLAGASPRLRSRPSPARCRSARRTSNLAPQAASWNPPPRPGFPAAGAAAAGGGPEGGKGQPC